MTLGAPIAAQDSGVTLDDRLSEADYLKGLTDLDLPEVLEHYIQTHPAQDEVEAAMYDIARQRLRINAADTADARIAAVEELLRVRENLINTHQGDPRRALWRTDQAADLFFLLLPHDASGVTALFGVAAPVQEARARRVADEMNRHMNQAEREIERAIFDLENQPGFSDSIAMQMRRRRMADDERDRRIPFFRGIGAALFADLSASDASEQRTHYDIAVTRLIPLLERLSPELGDRAALYAGLAQTGKGELTEADGLFDRVISGGRADEIDLFSARIGKVEAVRQNQGAVEALQALSNLQVQYAASDDILFRVLLADQAFEIHQAQAADATGAAARTHRLSAYRAYLDLLNAAGDLPSEVIEAIVLSRLSMVAGSDAPLDQLPPMVTIAVAQRLGESEETRAEAIGRLEALLDRNDLADGDRAGALFALGRALYQDDRQIDAATRFMQLASRYPTDRRAEHAIELAASLADAAYRETPDSPAARSTLRETLALLMDRFPNLSGIDRWRYAAGRLALDGKDYPQAIRHFNAIATDASQWLDGLYMESASVRAQLRDQQNAAAGTGQLRTTANALLTSISRSRRALEQGLVRAADEKRRDDLRWYLGFLRVFEAEANLALRDGSAALDAVANIERDAQLDGSIIAQALRARIDAYQLLGRTSEASQEIERFLREAPEQAGDVITPLLATVINEVESLIALNRDDEARQLAQQQLLPHADYLERWLRDASIADGRRRSVSFQLAEALRYGDENEKALALYEMLLVDRPDALELLTGKAEALYGIGDADRLGDAMTIFRRIAGTVEAGSQPYWRAQLRMLQILDAVNRNTQQIAPRIRRLQQQYPELGGDPWRRQLQALLSKYG